MLGSIVTQAKGLNPYAMANGMTYASTTSTTNVAVASVTGSGMITSISQSLLGVGEQNVVFYGYITLVIDGVTVISDHFISRVFESGGWTKSCVMQEIGSNLLSGFIKFNSGFTLYHRTNSTVPTVLTYLGYKLN